MDIFFVISGFVMIISSRRLIGSPDGWKVFAKRRIERIVPMYWLATTIKVAMLLLAASAVLHATLDPSLIIKSYFFIPVRKPDGAIEPLLGVGWTLVFEMFFYAIFAIALATRRSVYLVVAPVLIACAAGSLFRSATSPAWMYYFDPIVLEFLAGMLIAEAASRARTPPLWVGWLCLIAGFAYLLTSPDGHSLPRVINCGLPAAMIVYGTVRLEPIIGPSMPRWLLWLGSASYAIYLFHPLTAPLGAVILSKLHIIWSDASILLCWLIGVGCGSAAHRFVEPRLRFRDRSDRPAGLKATGVGYRKHFSR